MPQRDPWECEATNQEPRDVGDYDGVMARLNDPRMSGARRGWLRVKGVEGGSVVGRVLMCLCCLKEYALVPSSFVSLVVSVLPEDLPVLALLLCWRPSLCWLKVDQIYL